MEAIKEEKIIKIVNDLILQNWHKNDKIKEIL